MTTVIVYDLTTADALRSCNFRSRNRANEYAKAHSDGRYPIVTEGDRISVWQ